MKKVYSPAEIRARNKYNRKTYERISLNVKKGVRQQIDQASKDAGYESRTAYIMDAVKERYKKDTGKELAEQEQKVT